MLHEDGFDLLIGATLMANRKSPRTPHGIPDDVLGCGCEVSGHLIPPFLQGV